MRWSFWHDLPFRIKLIAYGGLVTALALAVTGVVLLRMETASFRKHLLSSTTTLADVTSQTCGSSLAFDDDDFAARVLRGLDVEPEVMRACVLDAEGAVFASFERVGYAADYDLAGFTGPHRFLDDCLELVRPVRYNGAELGRIYLQVSLEAMDERVRMFAAAMVVLLAVAMGLSLLLAGVLQRGLRRPIVELQDTAERVARERDFSVRARQFGRDELGLLTERFNQMLTRLEEREQALRESQARYVDLLGRIDEVAFQMTVPDGHLEFCSPGAKALFGFTDTELLDDPQLLKSLVARESRDDFEAMLHNAGLDHVIPVLEYGIVDGQGHERHVSQSNYPVFDDEGRLVAIEGLFIGITDRVQAEGEREQLRAELDQAHKLEALGTLTGGIAHDFNNILGAIIGSASLAVEDLEPEHPLQETLGTILQASQRAAKLTRQILAFSRQHQAEKVPVRLDDLLEETLTLLRASLPATISIEPRVVGELPSVLADPTQLHQVIMNLCTNAHHAMRDSGGTLEIGLCTRELDEKTAQLIPELRPGLHVEFTVSDTGEGIDPAVVDRIFEPFFTTKADGEGTGMGLAVVYGIVGDHGGRITVESERGRGTTFRILMPAVAVEQVEAAEAVTEPFAGQGRVLLIDDEEMIVSLVQRMLQRLGYHAVGYTNPLLALEDFARDPDAFDLVITDFTMPDLTGLDVIRKVREHRGDLPVVISTGNPACVAGDEIKRLGPVCLASKPFDFSQLGQLVHSCLKSGPS